MRHLLIVLLAGALTAQTTPPAPGTKPEEKKDAAVKTETPAEPAASSAESWLTGSIDFGYRWHGNIAGSSDSYRSVVNLGEGPKLLGADFIIRNPTRKYFDTITVNLHGWGGDPYTTTRVDVLRRDTYRLTVDYRNLSYFNFLPSYANPLIGTSLSMNQHSYDTARRYTDVQLDLLPGHRVVPYLGYTHNSGAGTGITDFYTDSNEYAVRNQLRDATDEFRGGVRFEFNRFHMTVEQGGHAFKNDQQVTDAGLTYGNRTTLVLGKKLDLTNLNQAYGVRGNAVYTKALFTASPTSWMNVYGQFMYSRMHSDVNYTDTATGNFVLLSALTFYTGQQDALTSTANQPHTSGTAGVELRPFRRLRVVESWMTDRYHDDSAAIFSPQIVTGASFVQTTTGLAANSLPPQDLTYSYNQNQVDAFYDLTRKLTLRGGYRYVWGESTFRSPELSYTETETGRLKRHVGIAGAQYRAGQKLSFNTEVEASSGNSTYFRTSLQDYKKATARARYQPHSALQLTATFSLLDNQNPAPTVNYDFLSRSATLSAYWTPAGGKRIALLGEYTRSTLRSDILYLVPQTLQPVQSLYRDNAHNANSVLEFNLPSVHGGTPKISLGGSMFMSAGTRPTHYYQPLGRFSFPLCKNARWYAEWRYYGLTELTYLYEGFRAHLYVTGFQLTK
jgi:hypothetical protein